MGTGSGLPVQRAFRHTLGETAPYHDSDLRATAQPPHLIPRGHDRHPGEQ
ncbi:hypothetical protein IG631_12111 [Alternaria alternata]|nr:hypothetical protein IG631_12111 [Alternaria alternata]